MAENTRALAAKAIADVINGQSLGAPLERAMAAVAPADRSLLRQLCYGTLREAPRSKALLDSLLERPLRRKDHDVMTLLMLGLHQLSTLRIPDHAAVAATVDAADALQKPWAKGLINAVLRRYLREQQALTNGLDDAAAAAHPAWLHGKIRKQWPDHAQRIIDANNQSPPMTLRVNAARIDRDAYLARLAEEGIAARPGEVSPQAITLDSAVDVGALPGFESGLVSVQDESAQLAALMLAAQPGEAVLDVCAAPGGKTCHVLESQPALAELVALDIDEARLAKVRENLDRLSLQATLATADARHLSAVMEGRRFDRILVDAPCSATGVIRRHPDIKVLRQPEDIASFAKLQFDILQGVWPLLEAGGSLLYVTCSIFREENQQLIQHFCDEVDSATLSPLEDPSSDPVTAPLAGCVQTLPSSSGGDGLFYAKLVKER